MAFTRPTSEQIQFRSALTGTHSLDTYLEATEKGGFTLPQLMGNLFTSAGELDPTAIEFRVVQNGGTPVFQARFGHFTSLTAGWVSTNQNFFHQRGAYVAGTDYERLDMVYVGDKAYICKTPHNGPAVLDGTYWQLFFDGDDVFNEISQFRLNSEPRLDLLEESVLLDIDVL